LASVLVAALFIVVFGYALANVTMRLQRHMTSASQWNDDRGKLWTAYDGLSSAAAAKDELAYGLLRNIAVDDIAALQRDSQQMRTAGSEQRLQFVKNAPDCLPGTAAAFTSQTPYARQACRQLLRTSR
jgi:hypothetical protein